MRPDAGPPDPVEAGGANGYQHGGDHYRKQPVQVWDFVSRNRIPYLEGNAIKYLARWRDKGGLQDLLKAKHYVEKVLEEEFPEDRAAEPTQPVITDLQQEIADWAQDQFRDNQSKITGQALHSLPPLLVMVEEVGEIARAVSRRHQGRDDGDLKKYRTALADGIADLLISLFDFSDREGIDALAAAERVWTTAVSKRRAVSWAADKAKEGGA